LPVLSKMLYTSVTKFPALSSERIISFCYHLQNGVCIAHSLQGQTSGSQRVADLGCK
jgi:hypothetical protein